MYGSRTPAIKMTLVVFLASRTMTEINGSNKVEYPSKPLSKKLVSLCPLDDRETDSARYVDAGDPNARCGMKEIFKMAM
ncbi:hypothetical protein EVAR_90229_1 [Eumeta japonica]|uniref:Secreted protein n=1 Tax=Eumeta variegata TaxID=151549 RepID=A0A4C1YRJ3_EUMVA|nr:hypothetical protein EVAR_90229_1 [Eumeta japonica]